MNSKSSLLAFLQHPFGCLVGFFVPTIRPAVAMATQSCSSSLSERKQGRPLLPTRAEWGRKKSKVCLMNPIRYGAGAKK